MSTSSNGSMTNEVQRVGFNSGPTMVSGTFTLTFTGQTTGNIAYNADAATVEAALEALSNIADGDVIVTKTANFGYQQEWQVAFQGALAGTNVAQITADASAVYNGVGAPTESVYTNTQGSSVNEVQVVTLSDTTGGTFTLSFGGESTAAIDWDSSTSEVDSALEALSGAGTVSVSGSAGGPYTITFTGDYAGQDIAALLSRANDLTNSGLVRTIAYTFNDDGDLEEVSDPDATYEYVYDGMGRVTNYVQNITGLNPEIKFESQYNPASRRTQLQAYFDSTNDFKNTYSYDNMQRLTSLVQQSPTSGNVVAPKRVDFNYNEISQFTSISRYASTNTSEFVAASFYSYDDMNRLTKLVHSESTTAPTSGWGTDPLAGYEYDYDAGSRILAIDSYLDGLTDYSHDDTYQLLAADHASMTDEEYEYDANGNRIMSGYDIDPNNQLYSDGVYNYTYDDEGNRLTRTKISNGYVTRYEWDHRNRLTKVTEENNSNTILQVTTQSYDAFNQWIRRNFDSDGPGSTAAADTFFVYESGQVLLEFDGDDDSDLSHRYAWSLLVDQAIADEQVSSLGSAGQVLWTFGDHLGTIRDLVTYNSTTDDAAVANHREWDSYGNLLSQSNVTYASTIGYTGRMWDISTGLQNNLNRWYDPAVGRWLSEDPIGFTAGDSNLNRYVSNSALHYSDPDGLQPYSFNSTAGTITIDLAEEDSRLLTRYIDANGNTTGQIAPTGATSVTHNSPKGTKVNYNYLVGIRMEAQCKITKGDYYWVQFVRQTVHNVTINKSVVTFTPKVETQPWKVDGKQDPALPRHAYPNTTQANGIVSMTDNPGNTFNITGMVTEAPGPNGATVGTPNQTLSSLLKNPSPSLKKKMDNRIIEGKHFQT